MSEIKNVTSQRIFSVNNEDVVRWSRGEDDVGLIDIQNTFIEKRDTEELSIEDAETLAKTILKACEDAREHNLKPTFKA